MSFIPRSPGIETLRAAHNNRGYLMAGLLGVVHYGDTRKAHSLGAARSPYFAILNNSISEPSTVRDRAPLLFIRP